MLAEKQTDTRWPCAGLTSR